MAARGGRALAAVTVLQTGPMITNQWTGGVEIGEAEELAETVVVFTLADQHTDEQINCAEHEALVCELDEELIEQEVRVGFTETDTDGNGRINNDEFRTWWLSD